MQTVRNETTEHSVQICGIIIIVICSKDIVLEQTPILHKAQLLLINVMFYVVLVVMLKLSFGSWRTFITPCYEKQMNWCTFPFQIYCMFILWIVNCKSKFGLISNDKWIHYKKRLLKWYDIIILIIGKNAIVIFSLCKITVDTIMVILQVN